MNNKQLVIVWRVYEPCNLGCHFCEYSREIIRDRHITSNEVVLRFGKTLSEYQKTTGTEVLINWLGGEPLLWKEFPYISEKLNNDYSLKLSVTTNGTKLGKEYIRRILVENYSMMTISIDGFGDFHDFHRGQKGLFEEIKSNVAKIISEIKSAHSPLQLRVNTVLMNKNIYRFEEFCLEIAKWGVQELTFNQLGGNERSEFYEANRLLPEQVEWLAEKLPTIKQIALKNGLRILGNQNYMNRIIATSLDVEIPIDDCYPGRSFLFIDEKNRVSPCSFTTDDYSTPISEIKTLKDLLQLPIIFQNRKIKNKALPCNNCHSTQVFGKFEN